jgi:membrane protein required for colicin V production
VNWLDITIIIIIATSVIGSVLQGLTRELIALAALVTGALAALWWHPEAARHLEPYTSSPAVAGFVGFFIILVAFILAGWVVSKLLGMLVKAAGLQWFDRVLGAAFGLLRGVLTAAILVLALVAFRPGPAPAESVANSTLAPTVLYCSRTVMMMAPRSLKQGFESGLEQVRRVWRDHRIDSV